MLDGEFDGGGGGGGGDGFAITGVELVEGGGGTVLRITWPSAEGESFAVDASSDLQAGPGNWAEVVDGLASGGASTSYDVPVGNPVPEELFVRVRKL